MSAAQTLRRERNREWCATQVSAGRLPAEAAPAVLAVLDAAREDDTEAPAAPAAPDVFDRQAFGALWFRLDEIQAVAQSIELVQEHVSDEGDRTRKVDGLARAIAELARHALQAFDALERSLAHA